MLPTCKARQPVITTLYHSDWTIFLTEISVQVLYMSSRLRYTPQSICINEFAKEATKEHDATELGTTCAYITEGAVVGFQGHARAHRRRGF